MRATRFAIAIAGTLLLSACCLSGKAPRAYIAWTSPTLPDSRVAAIRRQCDADAREAARERFDAHLALLQRECAAGQPFSDFTVLDENAGTPIEGELRESVLRSYRYACSIIAENPRPTPDDLGSTCVDCRPRLPAEACYAKHELVPETRYRQACRPMRTL